ncbi:L-type lectin-domain containing receptor kinase IX.1-like [Miscanthus floridulus]|uniref:L-type lectin-domain containing receptor kinase IX.1-like n=1 Tax=Miscanthus floridulus TaxID=154761 RepID=UPI00345AB59F
MEGHNEVALGLARLPRAPKDHIEKDVGQQGYVFVQRGVNNNGIYGCEPRDSTGGLRIFNYKELCQATRGFSEFEKFGGSFYRGFLLCHEHGLQVAIKRVFTSSKTRVKIPEVISLLSELRHRNIAQLIGWCHEADELLLVYEFSTKGSLEDHLYSSGSILTWPIRYKIILGVGDALLYLHCLWSSVVVHGNIKPSSVMLDSSFNARLGDFGLAGMTESTEYDSMVLLGTIGYIPPELASGHRRFTTETDVYTFGVLLLELASGRPPILRGEHQDTGRVNLVRWVWQLYGRGALLTQRMIQASMASSTQIRWACPRPTIHEPSDDCAPPPRRSTAATRATL